MRFVDDALESGRDSVGAPGRSTGLGRFTNPPVGCTERTGHVSPRTFSMGGLPLSSTVGPKSTKCTFTTPKCKAREAERVFTEWGQEPQDEDERRTLQHHVDG